MRQQTSSSMNPLAKARIAINIMSIADHMYAKKDISNVTASVLIYLNLIEWYLSFLVRYLKLNINYEKFNRNPLGVKIGMLKKIDFNKKETLLKLLLVINNNRIKIIHKMVDIIYDNQMDELTDKIKNDFDEFNKIAVLIIKSHGIT